METIRVEKEFSYPHLNPFWKDKKRIKEYAKEYFQEVLLGFAYAEGRIKIKIKRIYISQIFMDETLKLIEVDDYYNNEIAEYINYGDTEFEIPPLIVKKDKFGLELMDGYHRISALERFGIIRATCFVYEVLE